jgi:hypothetical protein
VNAIAYGRTTWPLQIIGLGVLFYLAGIFALNPAMFIPGTIIAGIGGLLYYQNLTGDWGSWAYAWSLIPGFVGIGLIIFGAFKRKMAPVIGGLWNICVSLVLFSIFGSVFGRIPYADKLWPVVLVILGLFLLVGAFRKK